MPSTHAMTPAAGANDTGAAAPDPLDDGRLTTMGLLVETYAGLMAQMEPEMERAALGRSEFDVLLRLARSPDAQLRMTDLAAQVAMSTSGLTRLVDRLVRDGLVERAACPTDRRGSFATLTVEGRKKIEAAIEPHLALIDQWLIEPLEPEELAAFAGALRKLRDRVRPGSVAGAHA
ncbi:MAG TPA: MarR family transcriptional regulator [Acidimicrobiales bacterium]|jgi:DNA-binding MarR family transcriptional regulator|nr:MarR family transcriptional regulator [Acidimicrobiales bacterium]